MSEGRRFTLGRFHGRQVAVVGMGRSNQALTRYLAREGAEVTCFDQKTAQELGPAHGELSQIGARWSLGPDYLVPLPRFEWVFLTPGMKKNQPEIEKARENGAVISSEIGLFLDRCKCEVAAITGSAGKTTSCTLAGLMLKESLPNTPVYVGGNIGSVLIEQVDDIPEGAIVVLELSSFQLELVTKSPHVAVILNIRPNHLDIHESYEDYVSAKKSIYRFQNSQDWCFLNFDDDVTRGLSRECPGGTGSFALEKALVQRLPWTGGGGPEEDAAFPTRPSSSRAVLGPVAWADESSLYVDPGSLRGQGRTAPAWGANGPRKIADRSFFIVPGDHNVSNALGAAMLSMAMGATPEGIATAIKGFRGVEHRIEFVRELRGVRYFNDSIATSPDRTMAVLEAVSGPLVLILGGSDKGLPFDEMAERVAARGCPVVTLGKTAPKIEKALIVAWEKMRSRGPGLGAASTSPDVTRVGSLDEAVRLAAKKAGSMVGSSVVLSPACASYDMFQSFEERGRLFKEAVRRLE